MGDSLSDGLAGFLLKLGGGVDAQLRRELRGTSLRFGQGETLVKAAPLRST